MKKKIFIIIITFISCVAWIDPFRDEVSDGNSKFHEKKFEDAQKHYKNAEEYAPGTKDKRKLSFNKGDAEYMQGNYERAIDHYRESLKSNDRDVQKKAFLNMGNSYFKLGKKKEAVNSYIKALKIDPNYERAKKNIEYLLAPPPPKKDQQKDDKKNKQDQNKDQNKKNQQNKKKQQENRKKQQAGAKMSKEQIKNLLKSLKNKPVRRRKGSSDDRRYIEKAW